MLFIDGGNDRLLVRKSDPTNADQAFHLGAGGDDHKMILQGNTVQRLGLQLGTDSRVFLGAATGNHFRVSKQDASALLDVNPSGNITTTGMTGGNNLYLTGLPFTPATGSYGSGSVIVNLVNIDNNVYDLNLFQNAGQSYASFLQNVDNSGSTTAPVSLFDNGNADVFGTYMIKV
jgi:hypothetical protein